MAACPMLRPCLQCVLPAPRDELRCVVADNSHERGREHLHQPPARSRSPQQQAEHVHLFVATRLVVAEQFEQQRQLKPAPGTLAEQSRAPTSRVRMRHQRVCDIHAQRCTRAAAGDGPATSRTRAVLEKSTADQLNSFSFETEEYTIYTHLFCFGVLSSESEFWLLAGCIPTAAGGA